MSIQDLGSIGEFLAAIATLATLIYLAVQIRQNTKSVQSSSVESLVSAVQGNISLVGGSRESADIYLRGIADFDSLSEPDRTRFMIMVTSVYSGTDAMYWSYRRGNMDEEFWVRECNRIKMFLNTQGGRAAFKFNRDMGMLTDSFVAFVDTELMNDHDTDA